MDESQRKVIDNLRLALSTANMSLFLQMMEFAGLVFSNAEKRQHLVFYGVHFRGKLNAQDFSGIDFSYCTFYTCDFTGMDFTGANFEGAEFYARGHRNGSAITRRDAVKMNPIGWEEHREKYIDMDKDAEALDRPAQGTLGHIGFCTFNNANMKNFTLDGWNPADSSSVIRMWIGWTQFGGFAVRDCSFVGADFTGSLFRTVGFHSCDFSGAQMDITLRPEWGDQISNKTYRPESYPKLSWTLCTFQAAKIDWSKGPQSSFVEGFYAPVIAACDFTGASIIEIAPALDFKFKDCDFSNLGPSPGVTLWNQLKPPLKSVKLKLWKGTLPGNVTEVLYIATDELVDNLDDLKDSITYDMSDRNFGRNHDLVLHDDEDSATENEINVGTGAYIYAIGVKKTAKEINVDPSGGPSPNQTLFPYLYSDSLPSDKAMHPFIIELSPTKSYGVGYEPYYERDMLVKGFIYDEDYSQGSTFAENVPEGGKVASWEESPDAEAQWRDASMEGFLAFLANDPDVDLWSQVERGREMLTEMVGATWDDDVAEADIMRDLGLIRKGTSAQLDLFSSPTEEWQIFYDDPAALWVAENIFHMDTTVSWGNQKSDFEDWQDDPKNPQKHVFDAAVVAWAKDLTQEIKAGLKAVHEEMVLYDSLKPVDFDEIAYYLHSDDGYDIVSIGDYTDGWGDRTLVFSDEYGDFSNSIQFLGLSTVNY